MPDVLAQWCEFWMRRLFGGAISFTIPSRFQDVSKIRQVPDHQAFVDPQLDESFIVELLELKHEVPDEGSSVYFLENLAKEQDAEGTIVIEQTGLVAPDWLQSRSMSDVVTTTAVAEMAISKGRQGRDAQNILKVFVANLRLKSVDTDVLITAYEPLVINPLSESAGAVGANPAIIATQSGCMPMNEVFKKAVCSFEVKDWSLFDPKLKPF